MMEATRTEGLARLAAFVPHAGRDYAATRNEDRGPGDRTNVSVLSPYIRTRLVTEDEVLRAVLARFSPSAAQKFVQEVFWRTYWKGWLEARPLVWSHYRRDLDIAYERIEREPERARVLAAALAGTTGIEAFDVWVRELADVGYLHNHARMWFASIWIFTLGLPWEIGADLFMRHLLCGDPAANTLSWRWVAGLHTKGKTYLARRDNIRHYTAGRVDGGPELATRAVALTGPEYAAAPLPALATTLAGDGPALLCLHDDDTGGAGLELGGVEIRATLGFTAVDGRSPRPVAEAVRTFAGEAVADGLRRSPAPDTGAIAAAGDGVALAARLVAAAARHGVTRVVTPYAPAGPVRGALDALEPALTAAHLRLERLARPFDAVAWPHATRGFFGLKERIPAVLAALQIGEPSP